MGFAVRFHAVLNQITPSWQSLHLQTPVRWAECDTVEPWIFKILLLNAAAADTASIQEAQLSLCEFSCLDRDVLLQDEVLLKELFGLLVIAHYQTQAKDLRYLLDAKNLCLYTLKFRGHIVATAFTEQEGGLDADTAGQVYLNRRRVHGHLLAQTLEAFVGLPGAARLRYQRIVRIAVHPALRRRGLASLLLQNIFAQAQQQGVDMLGANFGATADLLPFWHANHFRGVHVGIKRNASSGMQALTVLRPISTVGAALCVQAEQKFAGQFPFMLAESYRDMECNLVQAILARLPCDVQPLSDDDLEDLKAFAFGLRGYDFTSPVIWRLTLNRLTRQTASQSAVSATLQPLLQKDAALPDSLQQLLIMKVLQKNTWDEVGRALNLKERSSVLQELRRAVALMLTSVA